MCFAFAEGILKFLFDAGDGGVKDGMGFGAEGRHCIVHQALVVKNGFVGIERVELLPVCGEGIGSDAFGVIYEKFVKRAFDGVEVYRCTSVRKMEVAPAWAGNEAVFVS